MNRSDPPLRWMSYEAAAAGLRLLPFEREWEIRPGISIHQSLTGPWYILEWLPVKHLTYGDKNTVKCRCVIHCELRSRIVHSVVSFRWHRGKGRYPLPGQKFHSSVIRGVESSNNDYEPKAKLKKAGPSWFRVGDRGLTSWDQLSTLTEGELPGFVEGDLYDRAVGLVEGFSETSPMATSFNMDSVMELVGMASSGELFTLANYLFPEF